MPCDREPGLGAEDVAQDRGVLPVTVLVGLEARRRGGLLQAGGLEQLRGILHSPPLLAHLDQDLLLGLALDLARPLGLVRALGHLMLLAAPIERLPGEPETHGRAM